MVHSSKKWKANNPLTLLARIAKEEEVSDGNSGSLYYRKRKAIVESDPPSYMPTKLSKLPIVEEFGLSLEVGTSHGAELDFTSEEF